MSRQTVLACTVWLWLAPAAVLAGVLVSFLVLVLFALLTLRALALGAFYVLRFLVRM